MTYYILSGACSYFRYRAIVSCCNYWSSGCAHPPLSCNSATLEGNAHDLLRHKLYLFGGALSKATLWLVRREPQMVHPPSHDLRTGEDLCPPPPGRWRRLARRNSYCRLPSFVDCRFGIRSLRAGTLGFGSCLCFCSECDHVFDSGALPARVFRSVLLPPGPPGLG